MKPLFHFSISDPILSTLRPKLYRNRLKIYRNLTRWSSHQRF